MLTFSPSVRIHAALGATDVRKSFDGLPALAAEIVGAHVHRAQGEEGLLFTVRSIDSSLLPLDMACTSQ